MNDAPRSTADVPAPGTFNSTDWGVDSGIQTYAEAHAARPGSVWKLKDVIGRLGDELREAMSSAADDGKPDLLQLRECTVELGLNWQRTGEAGVEFWVVKLGGGVTRENTQTISVTMVPIDGIDPVVLTR